MEDQDKREFFRIEDHIFIEYRKVTQEEYAKLEERIRYTPAPRKERPSEDYSKRADLQKEETEKDVLYRYIQAIGRKLDIIIGLLSNSKGDTEPFIKTYQRLNISGSGIRFISEIGLIEGDYVELRVALPVCCYPGIACLCKVVRSEKIEDNRFPQWLVAMRFDVINEEDRDLLINYIFTKERELIRLQKSK